MPMENSPVKFRRGFKDNLPEEITDGYISVTVDDGKMYADTVEILPNEERPKRVAVGGIITAHASDGPEYHSDVAGVPEYYDGLVLSVSFDENSSDSPVTLSINDREYIPVMSSPDTQMTGEDIITGAPYLLQCSMVDDEYVFMSISGGGKEKESMVYIDYRDLKDLRDNSKLVPGTWYRITDYKCIISSRIAESEGHRFDIIVRADDDGHLNENAFAAQHNGDTYFEHSKLEAWQLKYCLDNDKNRFDWADVNGKGVIYWMRDEWGNEAPYDFKNIMFYREIDDGGNLSDHGNVVPVYTFNLFNELTDINTDLSMSDGYCRNNVIKECYKYKDVTRTLNDIVFLNALDSNEYPICQGNRFDDYCHDMTLCNSSQNNGFGSGCHSNNFYRVCTDNVFGSGCNNNTFNNNCTDNAFGNTFGHNGFVGTCEYTKFGCDCSGNDIIGSIHGSIVGNGFSKNSILGKMECFTVADRVTGCTIGTDSETTSFVHILCSIADKGIVPVTDLRSPQFVSLDKNGKLIIWDPTPIPD